MTYEHKLINEKRSFTEYTVSSPTQSFAIGFELYEDEQNIHVTLDNTPIADLGYTFVVINSLTIEITPAIPSGVLRIQRETDIDDNKHKFSAGAIFNALSMDENFEQIRQSQQEVRDGFDNLSNQVIPLVEGLEEALAQADTASQAAQEAAEVAETAAQSVQSVIDYTALPFVVGKTYAINQRVQLDSGDIVQSVIANNTNNPNSDMTGWVNLKYSQNSPYFYGAVNDKTIDSSDALQRMIDSGQLSFDLQGGEFGVSKQFVTKYPYTQIRNGRIYVLDDWNNEDWCAIGVGASYNTFEDLWGDCNGTVSAGYFSGIDAVKGVNGVTDCKSFIGAIGAAHYTNAVRCYGTRSQGGSPVFAFGGIDQCLYTKLIDCTAEFTGSMFFTQSAHNEVINPTCINCNDAGIAFNTGGAKYGKVTGGTVSNCRYGGIAVESNSHNVDIFGVTFRQPETNSVMQKGDVLFSSFAKGESPCYQSSVSACKFYIDGTWSGDNNAYTYGIRLEGANNISISDNDLYCGDQGAYTGSHHALVFAQLDLYSVTDIKIQGNRINRGQTLKIFKGDTSVNYGLNNIFIKDNIIDTTGNIIYFPTGNTSTYPMGGGTVGILVEDNTFVKSGQRLVDGSVYAMNNCGVGLVFGHNTYLNQVPRSLMLWDRFVYTSSYYEPYSFGKVADEFGRFISDTLPTRGFWKQGDLIYKSNIGSTTQVIGWQCVVGGFFPTLGWSANTRFELDQVVYYNNKSYVCVVTGLSGATFTEASTLMEIVSDGVCSWKYVGSGTPQFIELRNTQSIQSVSQAVSSTNIAAGSSTTVTFAYSEARNGDKLIPTYSTDIGMLFVSAWCPADNNVSVRFSNLTESAITLAAGTVTVNKFA